MTKAQGILGLLAICGGFALGAAACSEEAGDECTFDTDCSADGSLVCDKSTNQCANTCTGDEDCTDPNFPSCQLRSPDNAQDTVRICTAEPAVVNCADETDPTQFCIDELGADAVCNTAGECELVPDAGAIYRYVQIQDATTGPGCDGSDPGSDIYEVRLEDASGQVIAYAQLQDADPVLTAADGTDNMYIASGRFDGEPGGVTEADACPTEATFEDTGALSLGCNGTMTVYFEDENGTIIDLREGDFVRVYEYSSQCAGGSDDDEYEVSLCTDTAGVFGDDLSSCANELLSSGAADGISAVPLVFPDPS